MPYGALRLARQDIGQRGMRCVPLRCTRLLVDCRAHQRVPEPVIRIAELDESRPDCRLQHVHLRFPASQGGRRPEHIAERGALVQSSHQERGAGRNGKVRDPGREGAYQTRGERQPPGQLSPLTEMAVGDGQFHQRERIAGRSVKQALAHFSRETGSVAVQQCRRRRRRQCFEMQGRQPGLVKRVFEAIADDSDQQDRLELQPPRHERQHLTCGQVQPVGIFRDDQDRGSRRARRQEIQCGERRQEQVRSSLVGQAERRPQRVALRARPGSSAGPGPAGAADAALRTAVASRTAPPQPSEPASRTPERACRLLPARPTSRYRGRRSRPKSCRGREGDQADRPARASRTRGRAARQ